jgi:hypothetical protein
LKQDEGTLDYSADIFNYINIMHIFNHSEFKMNKFQKLIARFILPNGFYCYTGHNLKDDCMVICRSKQNYCPFYSVDANHGPQENGYCSYLGKGDWDINNEYPALIECQVKQQDGTMKPTMVPKEELLPLSLLWDSVKECGIKFNTKVDIRREINGKIINLRR